jgi:hypothetical protein
VKAVDIVKHIKLIKNKNNDTEKAGYGCTDTCNDVFKL